MDTFLNNVKMNNNIEFRKRNQLLENNFIKALKDPNFVKVANSIDLPEEIKWRYTSGLMDVANNLSICENCKGLVKCPYEISGLCKKAIQDGNTIKYVYERCPYKIKDDNDKDYLKNVYVYKMPKAIKEASFKNIYRDDSNRLETIKELKGFYDNYLKNRECKGLYLYGNFGSGKTYLISALFNELAKKGVRSTIVYFPEFLQSLKASFNGDNLEYNEKFDSVKYAPLLLLDDIGAEKVSEWSRDEVLGVILQYRMDEKLPTFFTSNLTINELENNLLVYKNNVDKVKARRIIERIKFLSCEITMISVNRRI